jgi:sugar lactone lactonase YvrE
MVKKFYAVVFSRYMKTSPLREISICFFALSIMVFAPGCSKTSTGGTVTVVPTVTTISSAINLTTTTAQTGGVVTFNGQGTITQNGVCYSTTDQTPTTSDPHTSDAVNTTGVAITPFTSNLTGLTPNTKYYVRAYAINSAGVGYGAAVSFTTSSTVTGVSAEVSTFAGNGTAGYLDGSALSAMFNNPQGVSVDGKGNVYVSDSFNCLIREISSGNTTTIAGNQTLGYLDGPALSAEFYAPAGQAFDSQGNLYVADFGNNVIRKITPAGVVSTYAGTGQAGYQNGASTSASLKSSTDSLAIFNNPQGVAVDAAGNVFVADRGNNVIREVMPNGRTKTIAGNPIKGFIDATDELAFFNNPTGVAVDSKDNVYVTDQGNSALRVISSAGVVTTLLGNPTDPNLLGFPSAITADSQGNVYFTDEDGRVFEFTTGKVLYNIAGIYNVPGITNGLGTVATFNYPQGIAIDASGNIYVADQYNNCIRKIVVTFSTTASTAVNKTVQAKKK